MQRIQIPPQVALLIKRLGIVFLVYTFCRILFLLFNLFIFPPISLGTWVKILIIGLRYDAIAICYLNALFIILHLIPLPFFSKNWYQLLLKTLFYTFNIPALMMMLSDVAFFRFAGKRSGTDTTGYVSDFLHLLPQYIKDFWYLLLLLLAVIVVMEWLYRKTGKNLRPIRQYVWSLVIMIIGFGLMILGMRGGWQSKPLSPITAADYVNVELSPAVTNTPFNLIYNINHRNLQLKTYFTTAGLSHYFDRCHPLSAPGDSTLIPLNTNRRSNIFIIILESFSQEYMGLYGAPRSATPFLDSLGGHALVFRNMFANGTRSFDGIPAVLASLPTLMDDNFISSVYQTNKVEGLGNLLWSLGYTNAFFHGGMNGTMSFDSFTKRAGIDHYYGRTEYGDGDYDGHWGVYDMPFFQYTASEVSKLDTPFFATLFSLSSHHPYQLPEEFAGWHTDEGEVLRSIRYTDLSLSKFFETASGKSWFENTLFIITADHRGPPVNGNRNNLQKFAIPLLVYQPDNEIAKILDYPVQQADMLPSVLDYLNYKNPFCSFGQSIFRQGGNKFAYNYLNGFYQITDTAYTLQFDGGEALTLYNYKSDSLLTNNILTKESRIASDLTNRLKAVIQAYHDALINNRLSYP